MPYKPGDVARAALFVVLPVAAGVFARGEEVAWGAAAVALLALIPRLRTQSGGLAAGFGLLVLARAAAHVNAGGVLALCVGLAAIGVVAYAVALFRRRPAAPVGHWVGAVAGLAVLAAVAAAALYAHLRTFNLVFAPVAVLVLVGATLGIVRGGRGPHIALTAGVVLGGLKLALAFGLVPVAEGALARGDGAAAGRYAGYAATLGGGTRAALVELEAAAARGDDWAALERRYDARDPYASSRPFDAAMARIAFRRRDFERAAMYGDLATTAGPASPYPGKPVKRAGLAADFRTLATTPAERGWVELWAGRPDAARSYFQRVPGAAGVLGCARAWERAGEAARAAELYEAAWRADADNFGAAFGLLRTHEYVGLRGEVWRAVGGRYPIVHVGADLKAADGMVISKFRRSLGRTPATITVAGPGRRGVAVIAEAQPAYGLYPIVALTLNGRTVRRFYMDDAGEGFYPAVVELAAGPNVLGLWFENDYADVGKGVDRNVFIREVRVGYEYNEP